MTNTAYKTRKLLSMLSCAEKENDGLMLTHNLQNMQRNGKQTGCYGHIMNILNGKMRVCDHRTVLLSADCRQEYGSLCRRYEGLLLCIARCQGPQPVCDQ